MTALLKCLRCALDGTCLVNGGLNKGGCKVVMTNMPASRVVVDFDKPGSPLANDATRCDYLLVADDTGNSGSWVAVLELKRGKLHADQAVRQLQAGACAAEKLVPPGEAFRFRPVVASGGMPTHERLQLRDKSNMVVLQGKKKHVRLMKCGDRLVTALR